MLLQLRRLYECSPARNTLPVANALAFQGLCMRELPRASRTHARSGDGLTHTSGNAQHKRAHTHDTTTQVDGQDVMDRLESGPSLKANGMRVYFPKTRHPHDPTDGGLAAPAHAQRSAAQHSRAQRSTVLTAQNSAAGAAAAGLPFANILFCALAVLPATSPLAQASQRFADLIVLLCPLMLPRPACHCGDAGYADLLFIGV